MLLRSMQNTRKELADAKAENDALRDDVAAGRRQLHIKAVCQSVREATTASAWIVWPSDGRHRWTGLFHPQKADLYAKQLEGTQESILMNALNLSCPYRRATHAIIVSNTHGTLAEV